MWVLWIPVQEHIGKTLVKNKFTKHFKKLHSGVKNLCNVCWYLKEKVSKVLIVLHFHLKYISWLFICFWFLFSFVNWSNVIANQTVMNLNRFNWVNILFKVVTDEHNQKRFSGSWVKVELCSQSPYQRASVWMVDPGEKTAPSI